MTTETKNLHCVANGFAMSGHIFFNTESKKAVYAIEVHEGSRRITKADGGCLCRECIGGDDGAYRVFVECVLKIVQECGLELIERNHKGEDDLFRAKDNYWFKISPVHSWILRLESIFSEEDNLSKSVADIERFIVEILPGLKLNSGGVEAVLERSDELKRGLQSLLLALSIDHEETPSQRVARRIMQAAFLGIREAQEGVNSESCCSEPERRVLANVPYSEDLLRTCADSHILVADLGLSIDNLLFGNERFFGQANDFVRDELTCVSEPVCWRLICKTPVCKNPNAPERERLWCVQQENPDGTRTDLNTRQLIYVALSCWLAGRDFLPSKDYPIATNETFSNGHRIFLHLVDRVWIYTY